MQIGFHDGRSTISDTQVSVGDTCLIESSRSKNSRSNQIRKGCQGFGNTWN